MFRWCYILGFARKLISDRGAQFIAVFTLMMCHIHGVKKAEVMVASPWMNRAEVEMPRVTRSIRINKANHECYIDKLGVGDVYAGLQELVRHPKVCSCS